MLVRPRTLLALLTLVTLGCGDGGGGETGSGDGTGSTSEPTTTGGDDTTAAATDGETGSESMGEPVDPEVFPGLDARLSRYSYLVSLLPERVVDDLGVDLELRSRRVASYTPVGDGGLLVERPEGPATRASFQAVTGGDAAYAAWTAFGDRVEALARVLAPTLTEPLPRAAEVRRRLADDGLWSALTTRPLGDLVCDTFADDTVRGVVTTDGLIGMDVSPDDSSLAQNRCFLYHVVGRGTGEWRVPVGGMGRVADVLEQAQPLTAVEVSELAEGADLPFSDPAKDARLEEDAREAEPPAG